MKWPALIAVLAAMLSACSGNDRDCVTNEDCFAGEICRPEGICGDPIPDTGGEDAGRNDNNSTSDGGSTSEDATGDDGGNSPEDASSDDGGTDPDMSMTDADAAPKGPCFHDPFEPCEDEEDPDNNSFPGESISSTSYGCQSDGFEPLDTTISGTMCPLDPMDMYGLNFIECYVDEGSFVIEGILDVKDDCDPDDIVFDVSGVGATCAEPEDQVQCDTLPDGRRRIRVLFPGESNPVVGSMRFFVEAPERDDMKFDYDLQVVVRR